MQHYLIIQMCLNHIFQLLNTHHSNFYLSVAVGILAGLTLLLTGVLLLVLVLFILRSRVGKERQDEDLDDLVNGNGQQEDRCLAKEECKYLTFFLNKIVLFYETITVRWRHLFVRERFITLEHCQ